MDVPDFSFECCGLNIIDPHRLSVSQSVSQNAY